MSKREKKRSDHDRPVLGHGGEPHQQAEGDARALTTNQGTILSDNQNSLSVGARGPTALEDFILREKITHFDHERIPERVVHARGYGAKGYFQAYGGHENITKATFLNDKKAKTPVFVRFSTVAGSKGSPDLARDVRGFAVKFYTQAGNFDLVGNNIPVFFIQDAMKFPDLIHAAKPEPDRAFPQAQTAHDTFWDFASLMPESTHMLMWIMSDRAIPRSFRMMEGFGVHTFRLINSEGASTYVKFHWRPMLGSFSVLWDEAVKINGADPDFHRRDLWEAIETGDYPEYELSVQAFDQKTADSFDFDVLDATKLIPEEQVPLTPLGKMVLNENVDNFFAETEQVAFCPSHLVPGIDFTNDPLLQGRLFSYLDTQLKRLGSANFHELEVNRPKCPFANLQRDGHMRREVNRGRVSYDPNSLSDTSPRESHATGFGSFPASESGDKLRIRPDAFADHYTQARLFYRSQTKTEQEHIMSAFTFELGKVETPAIRKRMVGRLRHVDEDLAAGIAAGLGLSGEVEKPNVPIPPKEVQASDALSLLKKAPQTMAGRRIGLLAGDGLDDAAVKTLREALEKQGAKLAVVAPTAGGVTLASGDRLGAFEALAGGPSVLFDAVVIAPGSEGDKLKAMPEAVEWLQNAFHHKKVIGYHKAAEGLFEQARVPLNGPGIVPLSSSPDAFIQAAKGYRVWDR